MQHIKLFFKKLFKELLELIIVIFFVFFLLIFVMVIFNKRNERFCNNAVTSSRLEDVVKEVKQKYDLINLFKNDNGSSVLYFGKVKHASPFFRTGCIYIFKDNILEEKKNHMFD